MSLTNLELFLRQGGEAWLRAPCIGSKAGGHSPVRQLGRC